MIFRIIWKGRKGTTKRLVNELIHEKKPKHDRRTGQVKIWAHTDRTHRLYGPLSRILFGA
tara:strand:+ start:2082 stop:2261 length:180 start_codon:yes stop_codon:yes gene_type:complete